MIRDTDIILLSSGTIYNPLPIPLPPTTAWDYICAAPTWQKQSLGAAPLTRDLIEQITTELCNNNISCADDGSILFGRAAHAWCILKKESFDILLRGSADVYGDKLDVNSLRPESCGCIAAFSLIHIISSTIPDIEANVTYFTNSDNAVLNSKRNFLHDTASVMENDIDVTIEMIRLTRKCVTQLSVVHVDGHQDLQKDEDDLTPIQKINITMDHMAGQHVREAIRTNTNINASMFLPTQQIAIKLRVKILVANTDEKLRGSFYLSDIQRHYHNAVGLDKTLFHNVNWDAIRLAIRKHSNRSQMLKCLHNQWPTLAHDHKWNRSSTNIYPMCTVFVES